MDESWQDRLKPEFSKPYFKSLLAFVKKEREDGPVYPPSGEVFKALETTPYDRVLVVILGQDPYHGPGQAHGMSFSVKPGVRIPRSLANIYKELRYDLGIYPVKHGYLYAWARRGVLLLNATLTVREKVAGSHQKQGWETFTDRIILELNKRETPMVFLLWGRFAQQKGAMIDTSRHVVIPAAHPSPMAATTGFFKSKPFSKANAALKKLGLPEVNWALPKDPNEEVPLIEPFTRQGPPPIDVDGVLKAQFG